MNSALNFSRSFTFLEVLAALVILSIALVPIMVWVPTSMQTKLKTERLTVAGFLCQGKIEELHRKIINNFNYDYHANSVAFGAPYQGYYYNVTDDLGSDLKTISVSVWHSESPQNETTYYTQVARR